MSSVNIESIPTLLRLLWGQLMLARRYDAAAAVGALSWILSRTPNTEDIPNTDDSAQLLEGGLTFIRKALEEGENGNSSFRSSPAAATLSCNFCGKSPPEVKLVQGPSANICNECVHTISEVFQRGPAP